MLGRAGEATTGWRRWAYRCSVRSGTITPCPVRRSWHLTAVRPLLGCSNGCTAIGRIKAVEAVAPMATVFGTAERDPVRSAFRCPGSVSGSHPGGRKPSAHA